MALAIKLKKSNAIGHNPKLKFRDYKIVNQTINLFPSL